MGTYKTHSAKMEEMVMKRRILAFLMMLVLCITLVPVGEVRAAEVAQKDVVVNQWAIPDLLYGDSYGIYPLSWYEDRITGPISQAQFRILMAGMRHKLLDSQLAHLNRNEKPLIDDTITVQEAIEAIYTIVKNFDYDDIYIGKFRALEFMQVMGIYTGQNGEQALKDRCSMEQAMVMVTRTITVLYDMLGASSKGFLWEVQSGGNTVYLLGSIHVASTDIYPFSQNILDAYQSSDAVFFEADLYDADDKAAYYKLAVYTDGSTLKDHLSEECYQSTVDTAALIGISESSIQYVKPWYLYLVFENYDLTDNSELDAQLGIDLSFLNNAYLYQKPVYGIEGLTYQGSVFDSFSSGLQEYLLTSSIESLTEALNGVEASAEGSDEDVEIMLQYWHDGDIAAFKKLLTGSEDETVITEDTDRVDSEIQSYLDEYEYKILTQRDDHMADYIDKLLQRKGDNQFFVIVGSAHYLSNYSVLDRLEEKGYEINQIK